MAQVNLTLKPKYKFWFRPTMKFLFVCTSYGMMPPDWLIGFVVDRGIEYHVNVGD